MSEKSLLKSLRVRMAPAAKNAIWMVGGVAVTLACTVAAQQYNSAPATPVPCDLGNAAQAAMNDRIKMIAATSADPSKYFNQNCLGDFSFASLDLSVMIPDPMGVLTDAAMKAVNTLKDKAINKVCAAARNSVNDTIGRYNEVINTTNTIGNGFGNGVNNLIDTSIANEAQKMSDKYNLNYNTGSTASSPVFSSPGSASQWNTPTAPQQPAAAPAAPAQGDSSSFGSSIFGSR